MKKDNQKFDIQDLLNQEYKNLESPKTEPNQALVQKLILLMLPKCPEEILVKILNNQTLSPDDIKQIISTNEQQEKEEISSKVDKFQGKELFNIVEAAEFTGYQKSYIYKLHSDGRIKAGQLKRGGKLTFKRKDLLSVMFKVRRNDAFADMFD